MESSKSSSRNGEQLFEPKEKLRKEIFPLLVSPEVARIIKDVIAISLTKHHPAFKRKQYYENALGTAELIWKGLKNDKKVGEGGHVLDLPISLSFSDVETIKRSISMLLHIHHPLFQFSPIDVSYGRDLGDHEDDKWDGASCLGTAEIIMKELVQAKIVNIEH